MTKARLPRTTPVNRLRDWDEPPPEAVFYHGFWLFPDEVERLREIEEYHQKYGNKIFKRPRKNKEKTMKKLLNRAEAAELLHCSVRTIDIWKQRDGLPFVKVGHFVRYDPEELERWVKERTQNQRKDENNDTERV